MEKIKDASTPKVEVVENPALDAYRRHLQDGSDYKLVYREYLMQSGQELSKAVQRRAAESLRKR
jgi:hypothetical protein